MARLSTKDMKRVNFSIKLEANNEVYVAGTFNKWNPRKHRLKYRDGCYSTSIRLESGRHEYKFVINDAWCVDNECPELAPDGHGGMNSIVGVE